MKKTILMALMLLVSVCAQAQNPTKAIVRMKSGVSHEISVENIDRITLTSGEYYHRIHRSANANAEVIMVNSIKKDANGEEYKENGVTVCENFPGQIVEFVTSYTRGYIGSYWVKGDVSGAPIEVFEYDDKQMGHVLAFYMPTESVTVYANAEKNNIYFGQPFVGTYLGYEVSKSRAGKVTTISASEVKMNLGSNTVFTVTSTDENHFDFNGVYKYNFDKNSFNYDATDCDDYGLSGALIQDDFYLNTVSYLKNDSPENAHVYLVSKTPASNVKVAANASGNKQLFAYDLKYVFIDREIHNAQFATLSFKKQSSIDAEGAVAIIAIDSVATYRYDLNGGVPSFTAKGKEAGVYTNAQNETLTLDGFGFATIGGVEVEYTINGELVTIGEDTYTINIANKTFTKNDSGAIATWDGPTDFYSGTLDNGEFQAAGNNRKVEVYLTLDMEKNEASLRINYYNDYGYTGWGDSDSISDVRSFVYDASAGTITVMDFLMGTGEANKYQRGSVVFSVSADKKTLTMQNEKIYKPYSTNYFLNAAGITLNARN